ncbi:Sedlin, N-terminal conserved region-domain-containing protein, partial [Jimgerdemannia flammicorona]
MTSSHYFAIIGSKDNPVYEAEFSKPTSSAPDGFKDKHLYEFVVHSALDRVEEMQWNSTATFNEYLISAFVSAGNIKLMLLHDPKAEESSIKSFFQDVHELYLKLNQIISSPYFDGKVRLGDVDGVRSLCVAARCGLNKRWEVAMAKSRWLQRNVDGNVEISLADLSKGVAICID